MPRLAALVLVLVGTSACGHAWDRLAPCDGRCDDALRLIAPLSGATATTPRPTFRWRPADASLRFELCADRACEHTVGDAVAAQGSYRPTADLSRGVHYWRVVAGDQHSAVWSVRVGTANVSADTSWGTPLDQDDDGRDELAVGAPFAGGNAGRVALFAPDATGHFVSAGSLAAPHGATFFGSTVASAGDLDGDGFAELLVGATGQVLVFAGSATGVRTDAPVVALAQPHEANSTFGAAFCSAGDVNGDGYADVAVGAANTMGSGHVFVYQGGPGGVPATWSQMLGSSATQDTASQLGHEMAYAGDVDGDGFGDLIAGTGLDSTTYANAGNAYLYHGSAAGLVAAPVWRPTLAAGALDAFGASVDGGADVNGDGRADVVLGAPRTTSPTGQQDAGAVYLLVNTGSAGGFVLDRFDAPEGAGAHFGSQVVMLGDVDGDGLAEFAALSVASRQLHVYRGRADHRNGTPSRATITLWTSFALPASALPTALVRSDPDGDGQQALVAGSGTQGHAWVFAPDASGLHLSGTLEAASSGESFGAALAAAMAPPRRPRDRASTL